LRCGVLRREGQTGKQGQISHKSEHGLTVANRWPFTEIQPTGNGGDRKPCELVTYVSKTLRASIHSSGRQTRRGFRRSIRFARPELGRVTRSSTPNRLGKPGCARRIHPNRRRQIGRVTLWP
jgi:hypothetical protein